MSEAGGEKEKATLLEVQSRQGEVARAKGRSGLSSGGELRGGRVTVNVGALVSGSCSPSRTCRRTYVCERRRRPACVMGYEGERRGGGGKKRAADGGRVDRGQRDESARGATVVRA